MEDSDERILQIVNDNAARNNSKNTQLFFIFYNYF